MGEKLAPSTMNFSNWQEGVDIYVESIIFRKENIVFTQETF